MKNNFVNALTRKMHNVIFETKKHSPEILVGAGIVGGVTAAVMACKATLKVDQVLVESKEKIEKVHAVANDEKMADKYTKEDEKKDLTIIYAQTGFKLVKLYAPAIMLGATSIACILYSHKILNKRNLALAAAYTAVDNGFKAYRERVVDRFGERTDRELRYNIQAQEVEYTEVDETTGEEKTVKKTVERSQYDGYSEYARYFEEYTRDSKGNVVRNNCWQSNNEYNIMFLKNQERYANDILRAKGRLFLNEVYRMLGIPESQAGQIVGWVYDEEEAAHRGDNYVDFGLYKSQDSYSDFIYGNDNGILLDFNVDGNVWVNM